MLLLLSEFARGLPKLHVWSYFMKILTISAKLIIVIKKSFLNVLSYLTKRGPRWDTVVRNSKKGAKQKNQNFYFIFYVPVKRRS